jgi:hypothetical protein
MLILASASDKIQLAVNSPGSIDVHASWMDNVAGAVGPGRTNTPTITTASTVDIVGPPAASVQRNVKTIQIRNRGAANNGVSVIHTDGSTVVTLYNVILGPGATLQYIDEVGFLPPVVGVQ